MPGSTPDVISKRLAITVTDREDAGLHISSPDVPGLHLSGADKATVWSRVGPAITALLLANKNERVVHIYLPAEEVAFNGPSPREVCAHARYVHVFVELAAA